jgi:radical SAM/Cys-rich protein
MAPFEMKAEHGSGPSDSAVVEPFAERLTRHGLVLKRGRTQTLQINLGLLCNQACRHCHLGAGPGRREIMGRATMEQVIDFARLHRFASIDITGGAPEMNPNLDYLLMQLAPLGARLMLRSNLTVPPRGKEENLLDLCQRHKVVIITSLPATGGGQTDEVRGQGVFEKTISMLKKLNDLGYGRPGSGLELNLVANPAGAFLPPAQCQAEKKFRRDLERKWSISFNHLFTFANVPLGRFRDWLKESGNFNTYMERLAAGFNPATVDALMCRTLISVSWDGYIHDCDFNLAAGLTLGNNRRHITELKGVPPPGEAIATDDYCYACTAGSGFT